MIKQTITPQDAVDLLNNALERDSQAVKALTETRVPVSDSPDGLIADDCPIQVSQENTVGLLGIINGLFGTDEDGYGCIAAAYDENGNLVSFIVRDVN
ncbi:MAG TPA: hypothetical protein VD757_00405 [Candidatus Nitrosocosmicus sp.]|nr:hypothetical protein [Candidatus Nitrosocosmicus sp.]